MKFNEKLLKDFYEATKNVEIQTYMEEWEDGREALVAYLPAANNYSQTTIDKVTAAIGAIVRYNGWSNYNSEGGIYYVKNNRGELYLANPVHNAHTQELVNMSLSANYAGNYEDFKATIGSTSAGGEQSFSSNTAVGNGSFFAKNKNLIIVVAIGAVALFFYLRNKKPIPVGA